MPIYEYRCEQGHTFEVMQRMSDDPVQTCQTCEAPVARVFNPIAVHFKGSGFYNTDYGTRRRARENAAESGKDGSSDSKGSDSKGSDSKGSEAPKSSSETKAAASTTSSPN